MARARFRKATYELVAKVLPEWLSGKRLFVVASEFADAFEKDNEQFDRKRFMAACKTKLEG